VSAPEALADPETLAAIVARLDPAARLVGHRHLDGGVSATMVALDLEQDGAAHTVILRLPGPVNLAADPESAAHEHAVLELLARHDLPAPRPLMLDTARDLLPVDYLVLGWLEGRVAFAPRDREISARAMADLMVRIHGIAAGPELGFLPQAGHPLDALARPVADDHPYALDPASIAGLEALRPLVALHAPVLLHGDFWPGNMLWVNRELVAAIDWEDAMTGDPLADVAVARLDIAIFWGIGAMNAFTRRYVEATGRDTAALPLWDLVAARRAPADYQDWGDGWAELGRSDMNAKRMTTARQRFADAALKGIAGYRQAARA
jgi:aminoglycoside phosphotransferase (APT) family kinase protein